MSPGISASTDQAKSSATRMSEGRMRDLGREKGPARNGVNAHVIVVAVDRKKKKEKKFFFLKIKKISNFSICLIWYSVLYR